MSANFGIKRLPTWVQLRLGKAFPANLAKWVTRVLVLMLAWTLGRLVWFWVPDTVPDMPASLPVISAGMNVQKPAYRLDQLVNRHFFGRYSASAPVEKKPEPVVDAPRTRLNLTLVGLVASSDPQRGLAVIDNRGSQKTYGIGEAIEGTRVTLRQVLNDRVILRNNGRDEALMLAGVDYNTSGSAPVRRPSSPRNVPQNTGQADLSNVKAEIMNNPQSLLKYITLSQERNDEGLVGYRLGPGSDSRLFEQAGLQSGDVAVGINGADLSNPAEMNRIWQSLSDASEINLTVLRDGQLHEIYISL
ncbi:type II secretion system protein GspC [Grimontia hollisae]|uniref:General secretion pathway protein C n=2 Tax=Grimontia hollisae TaxID=673 RepID=D0I314_GRIHO|nr:type II secretion system protein GspC [Grimontia hollisae]AMG30720.1 type II secretion system protein GspC [Grimontia hollisae]EEY74056.1 general secretion pathway protein C [Grimontia hollisae CIP 101886]STO47557.1 Cholera toxin secretion protein epsC [Grimontia hollisae]STO58450.1 Cholera toxin secretion protein epsC [Grimontia hollisae]STQ74501.1 Cholera toxin secretion protein epsC [Grimontia hollisae]